MLVECCTQWGSLGEGARRARYQGDGAQKSEPSINMRIFELVLRHD